MAKLDLTMLGERLFAGAAGNCDVRSSDGRYFCFCSLCMRQTYILP